MVNLYIPYISNKIFEMSLLLKKARKLKNHIIFSLSRRFFKIKTLDQNVTRKGREVKMFYFQNPQYYNHIINGWIKIKLNHRRRWRIDRGSRRCSAAWPTIATLYLLRPILIANRHRLWEVEREWVPS